jgi:hypothetical protein
MNIKEFDSLLNRLELIMKDGLYVEDERLYVKCQVKYQVVNLMNEFDKPFMTKLLEELEYKEE